MVQYSNFDRVMEARDHFKNGASSKSLMNRGNVLKTALIVLLAIFVIQNIYSQTDKKNLIGAHFSFGDGVYSTNMVGVGGYETKYYYSIGLDYSRELSKRLDLCSGLKYTYVSMMVTPVYTGGEEERTPHKEHFTLTTTIPVQLKYHFGKFFYLNGGMFFNILSRTSEDWSVKSRDGQYRATHNLGMLLGCGFGVGFEHEFGSGIVVSLNPYIRWNGIGGVGSFYFTQLTGYYFLQSGISLGVGYKF